MKSPSKRCRIASKIGWSQGSASEESRMSCKLSLICQAGGDCFGLGQSSSGLAGHECHCPQAFSGDSPSTGGQGNTQQRLLKFRVCVVQVEQAGMALW